MQKAFDLIIERAIEQGDIPFSYIPYTKVISIGELSNVVNQVAEEYKQEVCEWKDYVEHERATGYYEPSCNEENLLSVFDAKSFNYCPYCGKRIFVKE